MGILPAIVITALVHPGQAKQDAATAPSAEGEALGRENHSMPAIPPTYADNSRMPQS